MSTLCHLRPQINLSLRQDEWCSGRFYHLKEVCWSDPTALFQRYRQLSQAADSPIQPPRVLVPFYNPLDGMKTFFTRVNYAYIYIYILFPYI